MMNEPHPRSTPEPAATDLVLLFARLLRGEVDLALAEIRMNARAMVGGLVMVIVAMVLGIVSLNLLAQALVIAAIFAGMPAPWAPVLVAGVLLVVALVLARIGISALRPSRLVPVKAAARVRRDAETLMERMKHDSQT